jgi:hypothetical protein
MTFFCLQPHDDVADAAINDAVAVINDRTLLNDVDGLVLISVLQSQNISFFAVFIMCFGLLWLQFPMLPFSSRNFLTRFSIWTYLSRFILPPLVEPTSGKKSEFPHVNLLSAIFNNKATPYAYGQGSKYVVHQLFEIFEFLLLCFLTLSIGFAVLYLVYKFYKFGSDPIRIKSAQELKIVFASSSSSGNLNSASANSSVAAVKVSYTSPSNVILKSIKRFNASTAFSGDSNTASISLQHFV